MRTKLEARIDSHGTMEQIRAIWHKWNAGGVNGFDASHAMDLIGIVFAEKEKRERRLKTISEDARRDRELRDRMFGCE